MFAETWWNHDRPLPWNTHGSSGQMAKCVAELNKMRMEYAEDLCRGRRPELMHLDYENQVIGCRRGRLFWAINLGRNEFVQRGTARYSIRTGAGEKLIQRVLLSK
eukprot:Trichotokara_eunicae@DN5371_c0_g1_i1.p1